MHLVCTGLLPCSLAAIKIPVNQNTAYSNGYLGSRNDEERSEMRYVMRIAEFSESSNSWTHIAPPGTPGGMSVWVSATTTHRTVVHFTKCLRYEWTVGVRLICPEWWMSRSVAWSVETLTCSVLLVCRLLTCVLVVLPTMRYMNHHMNCCAWDGRWHGGTAPRAGSVSP